MSVITKYEKVFAYNWYDGPISGVANKNGNPYYFEYQGYNESSKDIYYLSPITESLLLLVIEDWQIWKRWDVAFHKGGVDKKNHPYLLEDKKRGIEIKTILDKALKIDSLNYLEFDAEFKITEKQDKVLGQKNLLVKWVEIDNT